MVLYKDLSINILNLRNHGRLYITDLVLKHSEEICRDCIERDFIEYILNVEQMDGFIVIINHLPIAFLFYIKENNSIVIELVGNKNIPEYKHFQFGSYLLKLTEQHAKEIYIENIKVESLPGAVKYYRKNNYKFLYYSEYFTYLTEYFRKTIPDTYTLYKKIKINNKKSTRQNINLVLHIQLLSLFLILYSIFSIPFILCFLK